MRPKSYNVGLRRFGLASVVLAAICWTACKTVVVVPTIPRCIPLTSGARAELHKHCSIPATTNPQGALVLCPNIERWLGELDNYCDAIDVLTGVE